MQMAKKKGAPGRAAGGERDFGRLEHLRHEHVGRLLTNGSRVFERIAMERLQALGFSELRITHLALIRDLPAEGIRTSDLAELAAMTKQAVGQLAMELEDAGYVARLPDPTDGRAKLLRYTERGLTLLDAIPGVLKSTEAELKRRIGEREFESMKRSLTKLTASMRSE
jgi:DNA-binding MarR family transcriptional regulator